MYFLLACSIVSLTFIVERIIFWVDVSRRSRSEEVETVLEHLRHNRIKESLKVAKDSQDPVVQTLFRSLNHGSKALKEALSLEIDHSVERTRRSLGVIATMVTLSPLLGIFGTVTGIIQSLDLLGGSGIADPHAVSVGISQALITTAAGLAIAMPSLIFHNYFSSASDRFAFRLERHAAEFEILVNRLIQERGQRGIAEPEIMKELIGS